MDSSAEKIIGRFAPSPSGRMHLGNLYTALAAWLAAKSRGGFFLLRIEDLDPLRCPRSFAEQIMDDLRWLGLTWDNKEVWYQSRRSQVYETFFHRLEAAGKIYPCFCSRSQLHVANAPHTSDGRVVYPGTCRTLSPEERTRKSSNRQPAFRVRLPEEVISFTDEVYGPRHFMLSRDWGDIILRRSDGVFAYQLAVTVDDGLSGVTQVVRGSDLLSSAAPQLWLTREFGFRPPHYLHLPMLIDPSGARLAKRNKAADTGFLRKLFPSPEPLIGYLAWLLGQIPVPEPLKADELLPLFDTKKIPRNDLLIPEGYWQIGIKK